MVPAIVAIASAIAAIADILMTLGTILALIELLFDPKGKEKVGVILGNVVGAALEIASKLLGAVEAEFAPAANAFVKSVNDHGSDLLKIVKDPLGKVAKTAFNDAETNLSKLGESTPDNAVNRATLALQEAFGFGIGSHAVTALFEAAFPKSLNTLNGIGPSLADLAGFKEVVNAIREPLYENAFGKSAEYHYRSLFKPELPDEADAVQWHSRRLLTDAQLRKIFGFSGLKAEYEEPFVQSAYRALSPFIIAAGFTNQNVDEAAIRSAAEFMGLRPQDVDLVINAVETRSLQAIRNSYVQEAVTAYGQGVIDDEELNLAINDANWGSEARSLAFKRAQLLRRINLARDAEATIVPEIRSGLIDITTGTEQMESAGIQPWKANMQATRGNSGAMIRARQKELSDEAKAETQRRRNLRNAAIAEFQRGIFDEAALTVALAAIPISAPEITSIIAVQNAIRLGRQKYLYGQLRTPQQAETLRIQVEAIGDQYKKELTTAATARQQLAALQVDDKDIQALLAKWGALRGKATATAVFNPT